MLSHFWNRLPAILRGILVAELVVTIGTIFFLAISVVHGLLVKYSGSIRPSVLLHALADFIVIPVSYGLVGTFSVESVSVTGIDRQVIIWVAVMVICFAAFVPALRLLGARSEMAH